MLDWPAITEPGLLERLALGQEEFLAFAEAWARQIAPRRYGPGVLERALGYPWARPGRSYVLSGDSVELLEELSAAHRDAALHRFLAASGDTRRWPLLAIGSNAAPSVLAEKFTGLYEPDDHAVLVVAGHLHNFDVGAAAQPTVRYGAMPATLFPSAGTAVRVGVLWVTESQLTRLVTGEISYHLGRIDTCFEADQAALSLDGLLAFVSRFGAFCIDDRPVALAAIPATDRTAAALSQEQLLDAAAGLAIGPGAKAEMLVRAIFEQLDEIVPRFAATVHAASEPFRSDRWTPYPTRR